MFNMDIEVMWLLWLLFLNSDTKPLQFAFPIEMVSHDRGYLFLQQKCCTMSEWLVISVILLLILTY